MDPWLHDGDKSLLARRPTGEGDELDDDDEYAEDSGLGRMKARVETFFDIKARGTTITTEVRAGCANFLANAYLMVVVPDLLGAGIGGAGRGNGIPKDLSVTGASRLRGVFARCGLDG
jgi:hypothetical protein